MTEDNEEITQLDVTDDEITLTLPNKITVGVNVKSSSELGPTAYDVAEFINILCEQTEEDFLLDVHVGVNAENDVNVRKTSAIGFAAPAGNGDDDDGDNDDDGDFGFEIGGGYQKSEEAKQNGTYH